MANYPMVPTRAFFTKGVGVHKNKLQSFELALREAGIEKQNLVYVSSIYPPNCVLVSLEEGVKALHPGQITFCVMARNQTNEKGRLVGSACGMAIPRTRSITATSPSTTASGRRRRNWATSPRTWPPPCWPPRWA